MKSKIVKIKQSDDMFLYEYNTGGVRTFRIHHVPDTNIYVAQDVYYPSSTQHLQAFECDLPLANRVLKVAEVYKLNVDDDCILDF